MAASCPDISQASSLFGGSQQLKKFDVGKAAREAQQPECLQTCFFHVHRLSLGSATTNCDRFHATAGPCYERAEFPGLCGQAIAPLK